MMNPKLLNIFSNREVAVLKCLSAEDSITAGALSKPIIADTQPASEKISVISGDSITVSAKEELDSARPISEIALKTGISDSDEVLRALYVLEGRSLVEPHPHGDFTSDRWRITAVGIKALSMMPGAQ